jgi:hypothetical protein
MPDSLEIKKPRRSINPKDRIIVSSSRLLFSKIAKGE